MTSFLQERASICLQCLFRPSSRWKYIRGGRGPLICCALAAVMLPVWGLMLAIVSLHPIVPSVVLFIVVTLADAILIQHPWGHDLGSRKYLWICYRADYDEASVWPSAGDMSTHFESRLASLKQDSMLRHRKVMQRVEHVQMDVREVSDGLSRLEDKIGLVSKALLDAVVQVETPSALPPLPPQSSSQNSLTNRIPRITADSRCDPGMQNTGDKSPCTSLHDAATIGISGGLPLPPEPVSGATRTIPLPGQAFPVVASNIRPQTLGAENLPAHDTSKELD